jgi:hypothetical protein
MLVAAALFAALATFAVNWFMDSPKTQSQTPPQSAAPNR